MDENTRHAKMMDQPEAMCARRSSAADRLRGLARSLRDRAHAIEQLADYAVGMSPPADEALWEMASHIRQF